jgi:predicted DCC family thiol-disulfide oxidoreductase YuxK
MHIYHNKSVVYGHLLSRINYLKLIYILNMGTKVFFNDSCKICRLEIDHYKKIATVDFEWVDITNNKNAQLITSKTPMELLRRLHVVEKGQVIGGAKAFLIIWSKIPKYNFLYKIFSIKPFFVVFHYFYEFVAYFLFLKNKDQLKKK